MKPEMRRNINMALTSSFISSALIFGSDHHENPTMEESLIDSSSSITIDQLDTPKVTVEEIINSQDFKTPHEIYVELSHTNEIIPTAEYELEEGIAAVISEETRVKQEADLKKAQELKKIAEEEALRLNSDNQAKLIAKSKAEAVKTAAPTPVKPVNGANMTAKITGYYCEYDSGFRGDGGNYCGAMANGEKPHAGAVACGSNWPLGTTIYIENLERTVVCKDRGYLAPNQIDVFSYYSSGLVTTQTSNVQVVK